MTGRTITRRQYRSAVLYAASGDSPSATWRIVAAIARADGPPLDSRTMVRLILATSY